MVDGRWKRAGVVGPQLKLAAEFSPHMSTKQALVLARGLGTRMRAADPRAPLTPEQQRAAEAGSKAMMPIGGRPFLDYLLNAIAEAGIRRVGLVVAPVHDSLAHRYEVETPP